MALGIKFMVPEAFSVSLALLKSVNYRTVDIGLLFIGSMPSSWLCGVIYRHMGVEIHISSKRLHDYYQKHAAHSMGNCN